ncbi:hypothetical protein HZH68_004023 [Vespula germanica]|uniref:Beta-ketoacyl synthase-like N-terminal domain-containing protein n=1 Tax=Vespula germanica TaxID=30212 RepID=A0A834KN37_VESGE|nr:hypothetical protein HZH68_004023 [Vespula germanica]
MLHTLGYQDNKKSYKFLKHANPEPGEEVVISGFAGRSPESQNMKELKNNIFNCKDCIAENEHHWKLGNSKIPKHFGRIQNIEKFDASFFGIHFNQAHMMDPMSKMMLEHAYEAIIDAGINPEDIRGTRTGVFVNSCFSDSEPILLHSKLQVLENNKR